MDLSATFGLGFWAGAIALIALGFFIYGLIQSIREGYQEGTIFALLVTIGASVGLGFIIHGHIDWDKKYKADYHDLVCEIVSLERDTAINGHFCLGCGYVSSNPVYYYYEEVKENTYTLGSLQATGNPIYIVETDSYVPSIYKVKEANVDPDKYYYNIYVPFGTVVISYSA